MVSPCAVTAERVMIATATSLPRFIRPPQGCSACSMWLNRRAAKETSTEVRDLRLIRSGHRIDFFYRTECVVSSRLLRVALAPGAQRSQRPHQTGAKKDQAGRLQCGNRTDCRKSTRH